jgi:hypothetical protein
MVVEVLCFALVVVVEVWMVFVRLLGELTLLLTLVLPLLAVFALPLLLQALRHAHLL